MKTERRHELQHNELADWVSQSMEILQNYWQLILAGIIGVIALVWLVSYMLTPAPRGGKEWRDYLTAMSDASKDKPGEALEPFGNKNRTSTAGQWALQLVADRHLAEGMQQQFIDRDKSKKAFIEAAETYNKVSQDAKDPFLLTRSNYGAAQAYEGAGNLAKAIEYYKLVVTHDKERTLGKEAKRRLTLLEKKETAEWYDWFFKHRLQPVATRPQNREMLNPYSDLPDDPELSLPNPEDITKPVFTRPLFGPPPAPRPPEKKPETAPEKKTEATPEKKTETAPEKKSEATPEKKTETAPEKKTEAAPEKKTETAPEGKL